MVRDDQLVFYTGCLGSKWSRLSIVLRNSPFLNFNRSDDAGHRQFRIGEFMRDKPQVTEPDLPNHQGAYFGSGMEVGEGFEDLPNNYKDKGLFVRECLKPFSDVNDRDHYLIKAHGFAYNLDWLATNFPTSRIIMVLREPQTAIDEWLTYGGFNIPYPNYSWYSNDMRAQYENAKQYFMAQMFIHKHRLTHHVVSEQSIQHCFKIDLKKSEFDRRLVNAIMRFREGIGPACEISFAGYNIPEWNMYK